MSARKVLVSERALFTRLKRKMAKEGLHLKSCRPDSRWVNELGIYYTVDDAGCVDSKHVDLVAMARQDGTLRDYEELENHDHAPPLPPPANVDSKPANARAAQAQDRLFETRVDQRVKEIMDEILPQYAREFDLYQERNNAYAGIFAEDEYRLILSCLHPDRCPPGMEDKFNKAFDLMKRKESLLRKSNHGEEAASLPASMAELLARRKRPL